MIFHRLSYITFTLIITLINTAILKYREYHSKPCLFLRNKRSVLVVDAVVLRRLHVHLVTQHQVSTELYHLNADEHELVTVPSRNVAVGQQHHPRHRTDVQQTQHHEPTHKVLQRRTHLAIGPETTEQEDQSQDDPEDDKNGPPNAVEKVMAVVLVADLGHYGDYDVDEGQTAH